MRCMLSCTTLSSANPNPRAPCSHHHSQREQVGQELAGGAQLLLQGGEHNRLLRLTPTSCCCCPTGTAQQGTLLLPRLLLQLMVCAGLLLLGPQRHGLRTAQQHQYCIHAAGVLHCSGKPMTSLCAMCA